MSLGQIDKRNGVLVVAAVSFTTVLGLAGDALAAETVSPTGKGIVGGALLGGEVVTLTLGAIGVNRGWPYWTFGGLGMVGGGIGGYFVEQATVGTTTNGVTTGSTPEPALYMLAGGMALVIPALVVSLNATAYKPPETDREEPAANEPTKGTPPPLPTSAVRPARPKRAYATVPRVPASFLDLDRGKLELGVPAIELRPVYTPSELWQYGVAQRTEVRVPLFKAMF